MISPDKSVLLVDDDPKLLRGLERHLEDSGYKIVTAVSAAEGLAALNHYDIDAVICDNQMPGTTGTEFLANVRRNHPNVVRIMLTGNITKNEARRVVNDIGVYKLFSKPCSPLDLAICIRQAIETANCGENVTAQNA